MGKLDGKVAAITGGTRSIGRGIADAFVREGASVVVNGRDEAKGKACLDEMAAGDRAAFFAGDASKQEAVEGLVDFTIDHYGRLDIMVLNSGGVQHDRAGGPDDRRGVEVRDRLEPQPRVLGDAPGAAAHDPAGVRAHHRDVVGRGQARQAGHPRLRHLQARRQRAREGAPPTRSARSGSRSTPCSPASSRPTSCGPPAPTRRSPWASARTTR